MVKADGFNDNDMQNALSGAWGFWLNTHHHDPVSGLLDYEDTSSSFHEPHADRQYPGGNATRWAD